MSIPFYSFVESSGNSKTGPIAVTYQSRSTCAPNCAFKGDKGCSPESGPASWHWNKVDAGERGVCRLGAHKMATFMDPKPMKARKRGAKRK